MSGAENTFPFRTLDRLPEKITPCPILEAIVEVRFVTAFAEQALPGMVYAQIRDRYPQYVPLPLSAIPLDARAAANPSLIYQPTAQCHSTEFLIQIGPRIVGLAIKPKQYPGWERMRTEITYMLEALAKAGFIAEAQRLGVRYINFFEDDVFEKIELDILVSEQRYRSPETMIVTTFTKDALTARLSVANNAVATIDEKPVPGSALDIDVWFGTIDFDLFQQGLEKVDEAHLLLKQIFFGLLKPDFLSSLDPLYSS